jgi:hypothetical protein
MFRLWVLLCVSAYTAVDNVVYKSPSLTHFSNRTGPLTVPPWCPLDAVPAFLGVHLPQALPCTWHGEMLYRPLVDEQMGHGRLDRSRPGSDRTIADWVRRWRPEASLGVVALTFPILPPSFP